MRLLLVALLPVISLAVTTAASPQTEDPVLTVDTDGGISASSDKRALPLPDNIQTSENIISERTATLELHDLISSSSLNSGEVAASPTVDKTETVDQSPDPNTDDTTWDVTGLPRQRLSSNLPEPITTALPHSSTLYERFVQEDSFPVAANGNQSLSSHIEVSGILISIDGVPTTDKTADFKDKSIKTSSTLTNGVNETFSFDPIEMTSFLNQIMSSPKLQNISNKIFYVNISEILETPSPPSVSLKDLPTMSSVPENKGMSRQNKYNVMEKVSKILNPETEPLLEREQTYGENKHRTYHGPLESSDPYAHWDSDSEEQEHEMELERLQDASEEGLEQTEDDNIGIIAPGNFLHRPPDGNVEMTSSPSSSTPTTGRSYLLLLAGNSTIVRLRQKDFAKYLKLNLAARLSLEYDDVKVNRVVLGPPRLLVNVSVVTPSEAAAAIDSEDALEEEVTLDDAVLKEEEPLHMLAETNATLLELSGEEYHVVRLLSLRSHPSDKKQNEDVDDSPARASIISDRHNDIELVIYTAVGGACALVILATLFITLGRYLRVADIQWPWRRPKSLYSSWTLPSSHLRHRRMGDEYPSAHSTPPTVIYSGSFAARAAAAASANSWVEEYQAQSNVILTDDNAAGRGAPMLGSMKLSTANPLYTDLEMGGAAGNVIMGHNAALYNATSSVQRHHSPSKLHIFSCRPGSIVIPAMPEPHLQLRRNLAENMPVPNNKDTHPLDVRIKEESRLGHDNPNYQT